MISSIYDIHDLNYFYSLDMKFKQLTCLNIISQVTFHYGVNMKGLDNRQCT